MEEELKERINILVAFSYDDPLDDGGERVKCKTIRDWWEYTQELEAENASLTEYQRKAFCDEFFQDILGDLERFDQTVAEKWKLVWCRYTAKDVAIDKLKAENASLKAKQSHACHDVDKFYQDEESTDTCRSRVHAVKYAEAEPAEPPIIGETCLDLASDCEGER